MTPAPTDGPEYRVDLVWAPQRGRGCGEQPGWTLYVDGIPVAHTTRDLRPAAARHWADNQLGHTLSWLPGAASWYYLAHPRQPGRQPR